MGFVYRYQQSILQPLRVVLLVVVVASAGVAVSNADKFTIKWYPNGSYTDWEQNNYNSVHVDDWLVFQYQTNQADVIQVNGSAFNKCDATNPISNYRKNRSYAIQLNESGHYYFICSMGYCYNGMKLDVTVHPLPPPSPPPSPVVSPAITGVKPPLRSFVAATMTAFAMLLFLVP